MIIYIYYSLLVILLFVIYYFALSTYLSIRGSHLASSVLRLATGDFVNVDFLYQDETTADVRHHKQAIQALNTHQHINKRHSTDNT